jgi:uroporphyrinogen decarboxylase
MTSRERVLAALNFQPTDRVPMDLGGMLSTGISCFAYPGLVAALGLPPRRPRVHDVGQMLALPDTDVLDALDCDVVAIQADIANAYPQPGLWFDYDFNGRLAARVQHPDWFQTLPDGAIVMPRFKLRMPPQAHVFEAEHGGQPLALYGDIPRPDLAQLKVELEKNRLTEQAAQNLVPHFRRARESTDRAILFSGYGAGIGIGNFGGLAIFPMLCLAEPEFVRELHDLVIGYSIHNACTLLEAVGPYIDVYQCCSDDWGTQAQTIASPEVFRSLFKPCYQRFTAAIRSTAPSVKTFLHSCGAIYDILDDIVECGFDVLNPVQWTAGGHSYAEWKDKCRNRIGLWGGGVNAQSTLPLGTPADVEREVARIVPCMRRDSGYVFNGIHNILAEVPPENVLAMYRTAALA